MRKNADRPTIRDVATRAGVSLGTVSRVLNDNKAVGLEVRQKVKRAIEELGFTPNAVAQSMRIRKTHTIGCLIREMSISHLGGFIRSAHATFDAAGYSLLISNSDGDPIREREILTRLSNRQVDGLMLAPYTHCTPEFEVFLRNLPMPIVLIDRDEPEWADAVMANHAHSTRLAVEALVDKGHRRIALITGGSTLYPAKQRLEGYRQAHAARGISVDPELIHAFSFLPKEGFRVTSALLGLRNRPTAIIAGGIDMLSGVLTAVRSRGLRIPEDVSIVATGHSNLADLFTPAIATMGWEQDEIGRIAANLLLDRLNGVGKEEPQRVVLPTTLTLRSSIGPAPTTED